MKKFINLLIYGAVFIALCFAIYRMSCPQMLEKSYSSITYDLASMKTLLEKEEGGRQCGYVNYHKLIELASKSFVFDSTSNVKISGDSVTVSCRSPYLFFGVDGGKGWKERYSDLPISFPSNSSFKAELKEIDGQEYIYIPYQILACLANYFKTPVQVSGTTHKSSDKDEVTISDRSELDKVQENGTKIQVEGEVFRHVSDVLADNGGKNKSNLDQLKILWANAKNNWNYISDPYTGVDTWRSASETIDAYYYSHSKAYSGDCDDFAILMASFARQVGFRSRITCVLGEDGGHAYAEFMNAGKWIPLDWFCEEFGGPPYKGVFKRHYENI